MDRFRLTWRLQRDGLLFCVALCGLLAGAEAWLAFDMRSHLVGCGTSQAAEACGFVYPFQESHGSAVQMLQMVNGLVPYGVGLVLGVPLVAREVEHRTALIAWPLARSRMRWLAWRTLPIIVVGALLASAVAAAGEQMTQAYLPKSDLGFLLFTQRGVPLVMRALMAMVLGLAIGGLTGRLLPALLIGIGLSAAISIGFDAVRDRWLPPAEIPAANSPFEGGNPLTTEILYRLPDGSIIGNEEGEALIEAAYEANNFEEPDAATLPKEVFYGIAADRYGEVVMRESVALGALGLAMGGLAAAVVHRRRPE
jgi:hypothetical protein